MNLMPDSTLRWRAFNEKKPYFIATFFLLALVAGAIGFLFQKLASAKEDSISDIQPQVAAIQSKVSRMNSADGQLLATSNQLSQITTWMEGRYYWGDVLAECRRVLIRSEDEVRKKYAPQKPGMEAGIWIEQMTLGAAMPVPGDNSVAQSAAGGAPNQNNAITLVCRAVDLSGIDSAANNEIVYAVERELKASPVFDPKTVQPSAQISPVDANGTFTFTITVSPQNPLQL
jgi:hypothetical protein